MGKINVDTFACEYAGLTRDTACQSCALRKADLPIRRAFDPRRGRGKEVKAEIQEKLIAKKMN